MVRAPEVAEHVSGCHVAPLLGEATGMREEHPAHALTEIRNAEHQALIDDGTLADGMVPKVVEAFAAIESGVSRVHIVGGLSQGDLVAEMATPGSVGTALLP